MTHLTPSQLREDLSTAISRVALRGERIVVRRNKKNVAALVSMEDLAALEEMEDRADVEAANKAKAESDPSETKTLEQFRQELGL